jgi:6,7-dimethyl-8-ribityllumazine synthase
MADINKSNLMSAGILNVKDACVVIVRTEWNASIVDELENGCKKKLSEFGVSNVPVLVVPGAFEIAFGIRTYWKKHKKDKSAPVAFIALGCVLKGDTPHFEWVCKAVTDGIVKLNLKLPVPSIFGVLTVNNEEQALERIGGSQGHKGEEAALTALKMISTFYEKPRKKYSAKRRRPG